MPSLARRSTSALFLLVIALACDKISSPADVRLNEIVQLTRLESTALLADGVSRTTLQAQIPVDATERKVKFTCSSGVFLGAPLDGKAIEVIADGSGVAAATFRVGTRVEPINFTAEIAGHRAPFEVVPVRAHAESLLGEASSAFMKVGATATPVTIRAILRRGNGVVSEGTEVRFTATQVNAQGQEVPVGRFFGLLGARTVADGTATVSFVADTGVRLGNPVQIRVATGTDAGGEIASVLFLQPTA